MTTTKLKITSLSLAQKMLNTAWPFIGGKRGWVILAITLIAGGMASNWGWLVAMGAAPILLAILPCAVMCGLGLCMNMGGKKSCASDSKNSANETDLGGGPDGST